MSTAFISCPADPTKTLGIKLPFLVMIIKNLNKYFTFEVQVRVAAPARGCSHRPCMHRRAAWRARGGTGACCEARMPTATCPTVPKQTYTIPNTPQVLDDKNVRRRFRASNYQVSTQCSSTCSCCVHCPSPHVSACGAPGDLMRSRTCAWITHCPAVHHARQALHLHHAHAAGRGLEPGAAPAGLLPRWCWGGSAHGRVGRCSRVPVQAASLHAAAKLLWRPPRGGLTAPLPPLLPPFVNCPQVQFNLADFVKRAYGTNYVETLRVQVGAHELSGVEVCIGAMQGCGLRAAGLPTWHVGLQTLGPRKLVLQVHANCRIRRIYFSDRLYSEAELPPEFKVGWCCWDWSRVLA